MMKWLTLLVFLVTLSELVADPHAVYPMSQWQQPDPTAAVIYSESHTWPDDATYFEVPVVVKIGLTPAGTVWAGSNSLQIDEAIAGDVVTYLNTVFAVQNGMPIRFYMDKSVNGDGVVLIKNLTGHTLAPNLVYDMAALRTTKNLQVISSPIPGSVIGISTADAVFIDAWKGVGHFTGTTKDVLAHELCHAWTGATDWDLYQGYNPPPGVGEHDNYFTDISWCGFSLCELHSFGGCFPYEEGAGGDPCSWHSDSFVPCLDYTACLDNFPLAFRNYLIANDYDIADYGDFGVSNLQNYSSISWSISTQQKWAMWLTLKNTNDYAGPGFILPPSKQVFDPLVGDDLTIDGNVLSWDRVTTDRRGAIAFPDRYIVYKGATSNGPWTQWAWVQAESSVGVFPVTLSCDIVDGGYWKVLAKDTQAGFSYEATGDDADWKNYIGFTPPSWAYTYGYKFKHLYE